ncbi:alpha/beta fold hydrolase [soil metagenome]
MKLHYRIIGSGSPQVLILHGLFGMSDNLQSFAKGLAEKNCSAILVDLRNHGHSPHSDQHTYAAMAADINELMNDLGLQQPVVFGHSMGGKVVMQVLGDFPGAISKAIIVDIAPYKYPVHHREILNALLAVNLPTLKTRGEAEAILAAHIEDNSTRQFLLKNLYRKTADEFAWRFNLPILNAQIEEVGEPTWPTIPIQIPVLFIKGARSGYIDESRMGEILQWYPHAQIVSIPDAAHWVHADQPQLLLNTVLDFIS